MKLRNIFVVGLAALAGLSQAQEPAKQEGLVAVVQVSDKSKPGKLKVKSASGKDKFVYYDAGSEQDVQRDASKMKLFFLLTPEDMVEAERALSAGDLSEAATKLAAVKEKYKGYLGLNRNPAERAALLEIECAVRRLDFNGLKVMAGGFPHAEWLSDMDKRKVMSARILAKGCTGAPLAEVEADIQALLSDAKTAPMVNGDCYGWLMFAKAHATAAAITADELAGTISEGNLATANAAIDLYCQAGASSHGRAMELPVEAMTRAQALLWAMPGVKDYAAKGAMDAGKWGSAPANFRDAVALAYMLKNIFGASNETIETAAKLYFNTQAGKE